MSVEPGDPPALQRVLPAGLGVHLVPKLDDDSHAVETLRRVVDQWADKKFSGPRANKRPDLLLAQGLRHRYVLIEFKRPSHALNRDDEAQVAGYRDDLVPHVQGDRIDVVLLGGKRSTSVSSQYDTAGLTVLTYNDVISEARAQLDWLLQQLGAA